MGQWIRDRGQTLLEAFGPRWVRAVSLAAAILGGVFTLARDWLAARGLMILPSLPSWVFWAIGATLLMLWWLLEYATKLRKSFDPKVAVSLVENAPLEIVKEHLPDGVGWQEFHAITVKGRVVGLSTKANDCRAYLTEIRKFNPATEKWIAEPNLEHIPLRWTQSDELIAHIPHKIEHRFNIVGTDQNNRLLRVCAEQSRELYRRLFFDKTLYQVDVLVTADGVNDTMTIELDWRAMDWDKIGYREISHVPR